MIISTVTRNHFTQAWFQSKSPNLLLPGELQKMCPDGKKNHEILSRKKQGVRDVGIGDRSLGTVRCVGLSGYQ